MCRQAGLLNVRHVALDSTKIRDNASKHKAMNYGRMKEREAQLKAEVDELLRRDGEVDYEDQVRLQRRQQLAHGGVGQQVSSPGALRQRREQLVQEQAVDSTVFKRQSACA